MQDPTPDSRAVALSGGGSIGVCHLRRGCENGNQSVMKKLGFLGAMNRDLVANLSGADLIKQIAVEAEPLVETAVSDALARRGAEALARLGAKSYLGGSAFNVARVVGLLNHVSPRVEGRFIGIAGAVDECWPHVDALNELGISASMVKTLAVPPATCLAMVEPGGRTLLTALGANAQIVTYLKDERSSITAELADCDVVHVTSFLDNDVPALLAEIIGVAKGLNPGLKLSLDPGAAWVFPGGDGFDSLLRETDILHLNHEELAHLTQGRVGGIGAVGEQLTPSGWMIVSRHHEWVGVYEGQGADVLVSNELPKLQEPIRVVDANGAGDTFCGAFLWAWLAGQSALNAAEFGFSCARAKVGIAGPLSKVDLSEQAFTFEFRPAS